ncbi:heavy-metal-associated domain-containing protein [Nocardia cyriacigeorgica]|uniref:heavy-metal-associated domain-containing protein n=1 Tax=Nocardia cyriacigeorgica TaxID=135487 RepID=UPI0013B91E33|nr:heavy metal-associated domain-containing protein [Nocardia cyriacigeorgica]NEW37931.1 heavy-metal-associated domain-containing protein [Nocardia cyriacigeorgica]NEW48686.1 heavy-metal-associated domain-containing protein [Nocardia cyriacigeorgica]
MTEASTAGSTGGTARYDRRAASRVLAELAQPGLFAEAAAARTRRLEYTSTPLTPEPGRRLTLSQRLYLERFMQPCRQDQVTSASHRITWTDSQGIPNTGHYRDDGLGPSVPIAAREAVLELWDGLAANSLLAERAAELDGRAHALLAGTTTDHDPVEIFRVGVEATGRTLAQHALLARQTPYRDAAEFARGILDSGIFAAVATRWYWELQASTYRRGMIPVTLLAQPDATVRYSAETVAVLRAMKDATIADAHTVMRRATGPEGLTVAAAIEKYHDDLDLISRQYALLPSGARPACLAAMPHRIADEHYSILPVVAERFVAAFVAIHAGLVVTPVSGDVDRPDSDGPIAADDQVFYVSDMTCKHCVRTIGGVLESMGIRVADIDLVSKRVVAEFRSPRNRARAFEAIRDGGYNPSAAPVRTEAASGANKEQATFSAESTR